MVGLAQWCRIRGILVEGCCNARGRKCGHTPSSENAMKAFPYLRVSTDRQEVEAQRSQVRAFADFKPYELLQIDDELDISGALPSAKRPVGAEILRRLDECDAVIFPKVDRLGRNTVDTILTVDALRLAGRNGDLRPHGLAEQTQLWVGWI